MKYLGEVLFDVGMPLLLFLTGVFFALTVGVRLLTKPQKCLHALLVGGKGQGRSPACALAVALAGTLGVGNIAGVATAITIGGAGAVFWMLAAAFAAMPLKYAEITLAQTHRTWDETGRPRGGAPYYIRAVLGGKLGRAVATLFALLLIFCTFTLGSALQAHAAAEAVSGVFGVPLWVVGVTLSLLIGAILFRGSYVVERVLSLLVPVLCVGFAMASVLVLVARRAALPQAFAAIWQGAFTPKAGLGGAFGVLSSNALRMGVARGLVSNEAGCGTAPTAHAAVGAKMPAAQGVWGIVEVFVDTVVLCTLTALVILVTAGEGAGDGVMLAISSFGAGLGAFMPPLIALSVCLFALATVLCWAGYGREALSYLTGSAHGAHWLTLAVCLATVVGAVTTPTLVWGATDFVLALMTLLNLAVLFLARKTIFAQTKRFLEYKNK